MKNVLCTSNLSRLATTDAFGIFKETENVFRVDITFIEIGVEIRVLPSFGSVKTIRDK